VANEDPLGQVRRAYADDLAATAGISGALREAFAAVPRERFVGPGPWALSGADADVDEPVTPDADPRRLYRNVRVAGPAGSGNGEPWFWAWAIERLALQPGGRVVHVGAGGGYISAIIAEVVGPAGHVTAVEIDPQTAARAAAALADRPNVEVICGDVHQLDLGPVDAIIAGCGFDAVPLAWVMSLNDGGRLFFPLTMDSDFVDVGAGAMLLVTRRGALFDAGLFGSLLVENDKTGRTPRATRRLTSAYPKAKPGQIWQPPEIASLRLRGFRGYSCWLWGEGWWLSTKPNP
jgi:protein-L-isoaspartate(D-aspartate) O-methyltransferase